jgi:hypothetical protein
MDYPRLLSSLRQPDSALRLGARVGSRVYGTAGPTSDHDFVAVLARTDAPRDLLRAQGLNVTLLGADLFADSLARHSLFALEAYFAPPEHRLKEAKPPFPFKLDRRALKEAVRERADADWAKAAKRYAEEPGPSRKRMFHALRTLAFGVQLAREGALRDFACANAYWARLREAEEPWAALEAELGPERLRLQAELSRLAR